jgi:outer membrane protein OmpA-like peptidoglycan-associated protein
MVQKSNFKLIIEGHTDNSGDADKNITLSEKRALAVKEYLVSKEIDHNRITALGYGSERPIEKNDTKEGRARNRRVEFIIVE